jgi:ATP-dependent Clp protease ATP-binding subunit ClpC
VGKTEIAKALTSALYDRGDDALLRLDMSEYAEAHAVARVVGAPPGYVGHEQGGALTDPMIRNPHRVILLDEIEKSHRDVHQLLLQVFDEGRLTDGRGRTVDFRHAVVIMTSNLGADTMIADPEHVSDELVLAEARAHFPVELWNRIEAPLVLRPLTRAQMLTICKRLIASSSARLTHDRGIRYRVEDPAIEQLIDRAGVDPALGARPLRHLLGREVESLIAEQILRGRIRAGDEAVVTAEGGRLGVEIAR